MLLAILDELKARNDCKVVIDSRLSISDAFLEQNIALRVKPTFTGRLVAEWQLYRMAKAGSIVLCFGNLPPLFKSNAHVCLFIQNMYLVSKTSVAGFTLMSRLRIHLERIWLKLGINHADEVIVQSQSIQRMMSKNFDLLPKVMPFTEKAGDSVCPRSAQQNSNTSAVKKYAFLYVASGEPHKNHRVLIEAWKILAAKNIFPSLCLTVSQETNPVLYRWIESEKRSHKLQIENIGAIRNEQMQSLYLQAGALIYPSILESLGLPLIEARRAGLPIIASELDYVRDIIDPEQSFDPESPVSTARAVERFLGIEQSPMSVIGADAFIEHLIERLYDQSKSKAIQ